MSLIIKGPAGIVVDDLNFARTKEIEIRSGITSHQTWASQVGNDYWQEKQHRNMVDENRFPEEKLPWEVLQGQNVRNQETPDGVTKKDGDLKDNENDSTKGLK